jgi:hypothetical protein
MIKKQYRSQFMNSFIPILFRFFAYLFLFPAFFYSCSSSQKPNKQNYHDLIQKTIQQDEKYLDGFKRTSEKNWDNNWKLMNSRIDAFEEEDIVKEKSGNRKELKADTNCIFEWNKQSGSGGIIRREVYTSKLDAPSVDILLYDHDSIYAQGQLLFIRNGALVFIQEINYLKNKNYCKPCESFSYKNYVDSMAYRGYYSNEFQFLDSLGHVECSYSSPHWMMWHIDENKQGAKASLFADTIVTSNGNCSFVEIHK